MALKNIASRRDIDADVLRQRRDFYAIAIGLLLFNLAGGHLNPETTFATLLPVKFAMPQVLFWASWCGFFYFLWRFWLLAPPAWSQFWKEISLQAGNRKALKNAFASIIRSAGPHATALQQNAEMLAHSESRLNPGLVWHDGRLKLDVTNVQGATVGSVNTPLNRRSLDFPAGHVWRCRFAVIRAIFFATYHERSFSDYVVPYLFAAICIIVQIYRLMIDPSFLG